MNYNMTVIIEDPKTKAGMNSDLVLPMQVSFSHNEKTYGNGYYVMIKGEHGFGQCYDLRYNKDFHAKYKIAWLADWADNYWNGENGAYRLKEITITRA